MAYYNRGLIKDNLGDQSAALADYTKAIQIYPEDPIAFYNRGIIYKNKEQYYKAISVEETIQEFTHDSEGC